MDKYDFGLVLAKSADSSAHKSLNPSELTPYMQYIDMIQKTKWKPSRPENVYGAIHKLCWQLIIQIVDLFVFHFSLWIEK